MQQQTHHRRINPTLSKNNINAVAKFLLEGHQLLFLGLFGLLLPLPVFLQTLTQHGMHRLGGQLARNV
jgi:hypothetical protein